LHRIQAGGSIAARFYFSMVLRQDRHTFIVRYTPPEGDLLTDAEREDLHHEEGKLLCLFMEAAARKMISRFRRRFTKVVAGMALAGTSPQIEAHIVNGSVEVVVQCAQQQDQEVSADRLTDAVVQTWERVANRRRTD
jgi:hypothetical protein